jgi:hypothetical protein
MNLEPVQNLLMWRDPVKDAPVGLVEALFVTIKSRKPYVTTAGFKDGKFYQDHIAFGDHVKVLAWMPFPEPFTGEFE